MGPALAVPKALERAGGNKAQAAREGAAVAGLLLKSVDFPNFVSGLIEGVFHAIVKSSIEQMEAYGRLVAAGVPAFEAWLRVRVRDGVDEDAAVKKINQSLPQDGKPISSLDDDAINDQLIPAARTQLATSRQQLLATMVLMGINRVVVDDGDHGEVVLGARIGLP